MTVPGSVGAVVQARMSSTRCPGKVLREVAGRPLLSWLLRRLLMADLSEVVVATSDRTDDDPIVARCIAEGVRCHRGPLDDVATRIAAAARSARLDSFVRISGDSPLMLPAIVNRGVTLHRALEVDVVTNVRPRSFPIGQSVEVVTLRALERSLEEMDRPHQREHVTPWLYEHPMAFSIHNFTAQRDLSGVRLAVDSETDFRRMERLLSTLGDPESGLDLEDLVRLAADFPA